VNKTTRIRYKWQEALTTVLEKVEPPFMTRQHSWIFGIACLVMSLGCWGFIPQATAQSGPDPEVKEITENLAKDPDNVDLLIQRGQVYRSNGKFIESLQDLEQAWLRNRENRTVILQRALTLSALGRDQEAEAALNSFLQDQADPKRVFALAERAGIRARTGRVEPAIEDYTSILRLQPSDKLYLNRGKLQESLGRLEEAASGYEEGLTQLGNSILLKKGLIEVKIAQGKFDEALALIDEQLNRSPLSTQWFLQRAEVLDRMGKSDDARKTYEKALSEANRMLGKRPTAMHLLTRAKILNAIGKRGDAVRDLQDALQKSPQFVEAKKLLQQWGEQ
jgi:tetratricopeptide (TPR) repeat protein